MEHITKGSGFKVQRSRLAYLIVNQNSNRLLTYKKSIKSLPYHAWLLKVKVQTSALEKAGLNKYLALSGSESEAITLWTSEP
jgi:hypothetical protein